MLRRLIILPLLALSLSACVQHPPTLYFWGSYEAQLHAMFDEPGKIPPEQQLQALEADLERSKAMNATSAPGIHAHLGYLYFQVGDTTQARLAFETEKRLFPESTVYMDRLITRLKP